MNHIYIIEDDSVLCSELALALEAVGYHTTCANDFNNVLNEFLLVSPDLVILDINLPNTDGFILCMKIRKVSQVPIIFITGRDSQIDELQALSLGGDDYITKPYSLPVLMARIKNTLKRTYRSETSSEIEYNGLKLDLSNCTVMYNNVCVELSKRETQILCYLLNHAGHYVSRISLIEHLWNTNQYIDDNTLSVNVTRIREKLSRLGLSGFIQILRSSLKSMTQEVSKVQIEKKEYQELIEKWAHELKAPIASITLVCENNPSELSRKILLQANRLSYNVEQVLYYARLGYMSNDYMIKRVSLEDIIHTAILNNKQLLIQNQFSIEVHTVDSFVYTDTKALVFILGQIINNSAQYRSSSPLLTFRAIDTNHHVYLEIQDNGTGIRESDLGRVFEKGFTGSNGHQRKTSTGIGLYLCKQLCKELGIEITIRSAVNKYTCVSLAFQKSIESRAIP